VVALAAPGCQVRQDAPQERQHLPLERCHLLWDFSAPAARVAAQEWRELLAREVADRHAAGVGDCLELGVGGLVVLHAQHRHDRSLRHTDMSYGYDDCTRLGTDWGPPSTTVG